MKKYLKIIIAVIACFVVITLIGQINSSKEVLGEKIISVKIVDGRTGEIVVLEEEFDTDTTILRDFLLELQEEGKIQLQFQDNDFGMYITGMGNEELLTEDATNGYYWTYESANNAQCVQDTYCTGADDLAIADGDEFVFKLAGF